MPTITIWLCTLPKINHLFSVVLGLGSSCSAQCLTASLLAGYYHQYDSPSDEFRYQTQYYGTAFWLSLAALVSACLALISILGEESEAKNYVVSTKKSDTTVRSKPEVPMYIETPPIQIDC